MWTAREALWRRVGYAPSSEQRRAHDSSARIRLIAGGERAGKSRSAAMELFGRCLEGRLYWLVARTTSSAGPSSATWPRRSGPSARSTA